MTIYFTSDTHFEHRNIVEKYNRGKGLFTSIGHHDAVLRKNWYDTVGNDDTVYVLGDVALGDIEKALANFAMLPGRKRLIPGNHDYVFSGTNSTSKINKWRSVYENVGFDILPENYCITLPTSYGEQKVALSHFPYDENDPIIDKWVKNRPEYNGLPLLHGHTHSEARFNPENPLEFHVGVDANGFTPVHEDEIIEWLEQLHQNEYI